MKHKQRTPAPAPQDRAPRSPQSPPPPPPPDDPLAVEGGRRSDIDGKFEADHRPSR